MRRSRRASRGGGHDACRNAKPLLLALFARIPFFRQQVPGGRQDAAETRAHTETRRHRRRHNHAGISNLLVTGPVRDPGMIVSSRARHSPGAASGLDRTKCCSRPQLNRAVTCRRREYRHGRGRRQRREEPSVLRVSPCLRASVCALPCACLPCAPLRALFSRVPVSVTSPARMAGWPQSIRSAPCVRRPKRRRGVLRSLRRRQHRRSAPARRRQSAELSARHAVRDRSAAGRRSVCDARCTTKARENLDGAASAGAAGRRGRRRRSTSTGCGWAQHEQTGIAGCFSVDEYERDVIKKHERTRRDKEDDRTRHIVELRAQTGVVFLTYRASAARRRRRAGGHVRVRRSTISPRADGVRHTIWRAAASQTTAAGGRFRWHPGAVHCGRSSPRRQRGTGARRAGRRSRAAARREATRSSRSRFPTTRCRSCPTTAR